MKKAEAASKEDQQKAEEYRIKKVVVAKGDLDRSVAVLDELEKTLPDGYRDLKILEKEIEKIQKEIDTFEKALASAEKIQKEAELLFQNSSKTKRNFGRTRKRAPRKVRGTD